MRAHQEATKANAQRGGSDLDDEDFDMGSGGPGAGGMPGGFNIPGLDKLRGEPEMGEV